MSEFLRKHARWAGPAALVLIGLLVMATAAGCGPAPTPITPVPPTPTQYAPLAVQPTPTTPPKPTPVPLSFPLPAPATTGDGFVKADDSNCRTCHTDEAKLRELAKEPEKGPSLSEGEG
ncbi:MAG: hypothetical protein ACP5TV_07375 [Anaerolineae bacterium]